ncbi:MAG: hypothetical protein J6J18_09525 [Oscillospiraceae bacterium]|nr:hypothetical protein [Oscillospiraceae bacterium]
MEEPINNYYYREKMYGLYYRKLIHSEISLKDVPEWLLEDTYFGKILYKTALDPDGCDFKKHYSANMEALENGIKRAQQNGNVELLSVLQEIQEAHIYLEELKKEPAPATDALESKPCKQERHIDWDKFLIVIGSLIELLFAVVFFLCVLDLLRRL